MKNKLNITSIEKKYLLEKLGIKKIEDIDISILKKLKEKLKKMTDPRQQSKIRCGI